MSQDALARFLGQLNSDDALWSALEEKFGDLDKGVPADQVMAFAASRGYEFDVTDISDEISEDALEGVAGGLSLSTGDFTTMKYNFEEVKVTYSISPTIFTAIKYDG